MNDIDQFKKMVCWLDCYHLTDFCYLLKKILRLVKNHMSLHTYLLNIHWDSMLWHFGRLGGKKAKTISKQILSTHD